MKIYKKNTGVRTHFREIGTARHVFAKLEGPRTTTRLVVTLVEWPHGGEYFNLELSLQEAEKLRDELAHKIDCARDLGCK